MLTIPDPVRNQALHAFSTLPSAPGVSLVQGNYCFAALHQLPYPQPVEPRPGLVPVEVDAAITEARDLVRDHGRKQLVWLTGPDHPWLAAALAQRGLRNEDSSGFESVENAMALVDAPAQAAAGAVEVAEVTTFDAYRAGLAVDLEAFNVPAQARVRFERELEERWAEYIVPGNPYRRWNALLAGRVVGTAGGVRGAAGINLFGGCVLAEARGHGAYRALVRARWDAAVAHGTPALTVQAGRMSRPILERLGFTFIDAMATYVDDVGAGAS
jgi:GNAT superfamily N-acetyltransferase